MSVKLDYENKSATAEETLRETLGVESTLPVWAEQQLQLILQRNVRPGMTAEDFRELHRQLREVGLQSEFGAALDDFLDE